MVEHLHAHQDHAELAAPARVGTLGGGATRRRGPQPLEQARVPAQVVRRKRLGERSQLLGLWLVAVQVLSTSRGGSIEELLLLLLLLLLLPDALGWCHGLCHAADEAAQLSQGHGGDERRHGAGQARGDAE